MSRSLCLVTTCFPPSSAVGARRTGRIARALVDAGWAVTVVCPSLRWMSPDPSLVVPAGCEILHVRAPLLSPRLRRLRARIRPPSTSTAPPASPTIHRRSLVRRALARLELPDAYAPWIPFAARAVRRRRFDVVLASVPHHSAAIAATRIAERSDARLVLDYRDPWTDIYRRADLVPVDELAIHARLEDRCLVRADQVIGVTDTICAWLAPRCSAPPVLVPNGYVPGPPRTPPPGPPHLVYAGSLAYGRTLEPVFAAMARLRAHHDQALGLTCYGGSGAVARAHAEAAGVADLLDVRGRVPHAEAQRAVADASAAVVLSSADCDYALPAKIFDTLSVGTPMVAVSAEASETSRLIARHGLGFAHGPDDLGGLTESLRAVVDGRFPTPTGLDGLTEEATMARLLEVLDR